MLAMLSHYLRLELGHRDKERGNQDGKLEAQLKGWRKPLVYFKILEKVHNRPLKEEEKGFHIKVYPKDSSPENRTKYFIFLDRKNWDELTNPECKIKGGYFTSRSMHDRVEIVYLP